MSFLMTITLFILAQIFDTVNNKVIFFVTFSIFNKQGVNILDTLSKIKKLLEEHKKTQKDLTDYLGISKNAFTNWSNGNNTSYIKHISEIADFFNVCVCYLLDKECKKTESTLIPYSGNERIDSIVKLLLNSSIDNNDLHIIEAVLDKYKG